jgi:iron complex transport system permease protein
MAGVINATSRPVDAVAVARRRQFTLPAAATLLVACAVLGLAIGPIAIAPADILSVILAHVAGVEASVSPSTDAIVWEIRLPRVILAALVGATLALCGACYQAVFRNPLADPYLLGVASGAGLAQTAALVIGLPLVVAGFSFLTFVGFTGAVVSMLLAYSIARVNGRAPVTTLILAGAALSAINVAGISYLLLLSEENTRTILAWLLGGLGNTSWREVAFILPYSLPAAIVICAHSRILNVLQLDENEARQLGVNVERTKLLLIIVASLATAAAVSVSGVIGFVGLVVPHVVRLLCGPDYRRLLPVATLAGASFLILADLIAKTAVSPGELPVGIITAFVGGPFFLFLLRKQRRVVF